MRRRVYEPNRSSIDDARRIRETFVDRPAEHEEPVPWKWPRAMQEIGSCEAVMYASDKWKPRNHFEDYKHRAEGPQKLLVSPGFVRRYDNHRAALPVCGPRVELNRPMPDAFAVLAPILGVQTRLYEEEDADGQWRFPRGADDGFYQIDIPGAELGAARHPATGEEFLLVYTRAGVHCVIIGDHLHISKDGIAG